MSPHGASLHGSESTRNRDSPSRIALLVGLAFGFVSVGLTGSVAASEPEPVFCDIRRDHPICGGVCDVGNPTGCPGGLPVRFCKDPRAGVTVPITGIVEGNGDGNQFQLFAGPKKFHGIPVPGTYNIFIWYRMVTNDINNGADDWSLGVEVEGDRTSSASNSWERNSIGCAKVGQIKSQCDPDPCIEYLVHGGAAGTTGTEHCEWSTHWEHEVGLKVDLEGPEASYNFRWGGSETCGEETTFDSESLFDHKGTGDLLWPAT